MGFFSTHLRGSSRPQSQPDEGRILVLARSSSSPDSGSVEPEIAWSMVVEVPAHVHQSTQELVPAAIERPEDTKLSDCGSSDFTMSDVSSGLSSQPHAVEMRLENGSLHISQGIAQPTLEDRSAQDPSLLVKYLLTHQSKRSGDSLTLATKVEHILRAMTIENTHLSNSQSESWIRCALRSLQFANILPRGQKLNINNFIYYVQQKTPDFQREYNVSTSAPPSPLLKPMTSNSTTSSSSFSSSTSTTTTISTSRSSSTSPSTAPSSISHFDTEREKRKFVKEVDYQVHLDENARMKAMFDWAPPPTALTYARRETSSVVLFGNSPPPGIHTGTNGSFWISKPQATDTLRITQRPNPYGGLM